MLRKLMFRAALASGLVYLAWLGWQRQNRVSAEAWARGTDRIG